MTVNKRLGSRRETGAAPRGAASAFQEDVSRETGAPVPLPSPERQPAATDKGGTPDAVHQLETIRSVRSVVARLAIALLRLERVLPPDAVEVIEDWGDNVKPAVDLLFRFSSHGSEERD